MIDELFITKFVILVVLMISVILFMDRMELKNQLMYSKKELGIVRDYYEKYRDCYFDTHTKYKELEKEMEEMNENKEKYEQLKKENETLKLMYDETIREKVQLEKRIDQLEKRLRRRMLCPLIKEQNKTVNKNNTFTENNIIKSINEYENSADKEINKERVKLLETLKEYFKDEWEDHIIHIHIDIDSNTYISEGIDENDIWTEETHTIKITMTNVTPTIISKVDKITANWDIKGEESGSITLIIRPEYSNFIHN